VDFIRRAARKLPERLTHTFYRHSEQSASSATPALHSW
jgi:hypothetical protein